MIASPRATGLKVSFGFFSIAALMCHSLWKSITGRPSASFTTWVPL